MGQEKLDILVVDDLPEKLVVYQAILEELGENVITARSGAEALKQLLGHDCAVILLDVNMPDMDGFETASLIRQRKRSAHTPIIFITAYADEVQAAQGYARGAVDFILAPVVPDVLRTKVRVFCELFRMQQRVREQAEQRVALVEAQAQRRAAEEAGRRFAFLAEAGRVLLDSLELQSRVTELARLPVPFLCDVGVVWLGGGGQQAQLALARRNGNNGETVCGPVDRSRLPVALVEAVERVLEEPRIEHLQLPPGGSGEEQGALGGGDLLVLPLVYRSKPLGAIVLGRLDSRPRFCKEDLSVAEALAYRGALAIENVCLYERVQEADRRKEEFMAMLGHELRNPLAPIRNAVNILRRCGTDPARIEWARELIGRQVQHLVHLVDDLLDVARITRGKVKVHLDEVDLTAIVAAAVEASRPIIEARHHTLVVELPEQSPRAKADPARLAQILGNLLNNAAKYSEPGGKICLRLDCEGLNATFRVRDTGVGISAEALPHIFEPFFQVERSLDRAQGGLGVGLALVRSLAEMHAGRAEVYSDGPGRGSEFVVRLPILLTGAEGHAVDDKTPVSPPPTMVPRRVLVVDDNRDAALSLADLLRLEGHQVWTVHDGREVLGAMHGFSPDVVLLDIGLPGMDGYQVAEQLRADPKGRKLLLIAITGYGQEQDQQRAREAGFDHHLIKPVEPQMVFELFTADAMVDPEADRTPADAPTAPIASTSTS